MDCKGGDEVFTEDQAAKFNPDYIPRFAKDSNSTTPSAIWMGEYWIFCYEVPLATALGVCGTVGTPPDPIYCVCSIPTLSPRDLC